MELLRALGLAFLGGMVLNLMPCVLPVLSLKIFDFVQKASQKRSHALAHGLAFTGGTVVSFWVLAGSLLLLRQSGQFLGWGFQLQSPSFLIILCALFFFFSLHLFGVFEMGYLFTRIRGGQGQGLSSSFFAGVTATLVATPCTGPFMGTALVYAFTQPAIISMSVFTSLALGMAFPYLLLSAAPKLSRFIPKPGPWMVQFKQFMGFPLLATVAWLTWVFGKQTSVDAMAALLGLLVMAGLSAWIVGQWMAIHHRGHIRLTAALIALILFVPSMIFVLQQARKPPLGEKNESVKNSSIAWLPFSEATLASALSEKKPVFIDFTADWCWTCKVNEKVALSQPSVEKMFSEKNILALKADWTRADSVIAKTLERYGRNSIPLYVLYTGKSISEYKILPQVLTPGIVIEALKSLP